MTKKKQEKKLTRAEHVEMELNHEQMLNLELMKKLELERRQSYLLQRKVQELEAKSKIDLINSKLTTIDKKIEKSREEVNDFNKKIMEKYKIEGSFGINPDTGEILEE